MKLNQNNKDGAMQVCWSRSSRPAGWLLVGVLLWGAAGRLEAASVKRSFLLQCSPGDASAELVLEPGNNEINRRQVIPISTGLATGVKSAILKIYTGDQLRITFARQDHESFTTNLSYDLVRAAVTSDQTPIPVAASLAPLRREVPVTFVGTTDTKFLVDGQESPTTAPLRFSRSSAQGEWSRVRLRVEQPAHKPVEREFSLAELETAPQSDGRRQVSIPLDQIEMQVELLVDANEKEAPVLLNEQPAGVTPAKLKLVFNRADGSAAWSENQVRVEKAGFEYRPPGSTRGASSFATNLTLAGAQALNGSLVLPHFQPVRCFEVPLRRFIENRGQVSLITTNAISARDKKEDRVLTEFVQNNANDWPVVGRMGVVASSNSVGKTTELAVTLPVRESRQGRLAEIVGSSIWLVSKSGVRRQISDPEPGVYDFDPCITRDGRTVYFSSNRRGQWGIWKKAAVSGGGRSPVDPGRGMDLEPAVFTPSDGPARVAFTRYFPNAAPETPPRIVVQSEDGTTFAETEIGRSPAWSSDGTRLAFVAKDNKIWIMDASGENPRQLTSGPSVEASPVWLPGDQHIIYASASSAEEARDGTGNFDLWSIDKEGNTPQQLTSNPSFDGFPVVTWDGENRMIYFLSNRGAQKLGQESWRINYFELR